MSKEWKTIAEVLKVPGIESKDGGVFLQNEQMDSLEAELVKPDANAAALTKANNDLKAANDAKAKAEGELNTANTTITDLKKEISELKAKPAEKPTSVKTEEGKPAKHKDEVGLTDDQKRYAAVQNFDFMTSRLDDTSED